MALPLLNGDAAASLMESFDMIGDYYLVEFIGRGGMGEVWLGFKRGTTRPRAIKILLPELSKRIARVESFRREAEIGMQLARYDSIVGVQDIHEAFIGDPECPERVLYLVLDFVDGVDLRRFSERYYRIKRERMPIPLVVHIIRAVLRALQKAHGHTIGNDALPVVHGDINTGNVMISSHGEIRVTDFGISHFVPEPTFVSRPVGTLPYMAPEQYSGRICPQNDLYSAGAVLHELLTGRPPLSESGSILTLERKLLSEPIPPLNRDDVPPELERLRRGLLEKNWELRIQTAVVALEILSQVDRTDCQDELKQIYTRLIGPPRSRLTRYLSAQGNSSGSFVVELLRHRRRPTTSENVVGNGPGDGPAPSDETEPEQDHAEPMPWLAEEDERLTTEVHHRPATVLSPTIRLEVPVGTRPPMSVLSTPTVPESSSERARAHQGEAPAEPLEAMNEPRGDVESVGLERPSSPRGDDELDVMATLPRGAAPAMDEGVATPCQGSEQYPPRPDHLDDGVPFQLHRPRRHAQEVPATTPASESDVAGASASSSAEEPASSGGAASRPDVAAGSGAGPAGGATDQSSQGSGGAGSSKGSAAGSAQPTEVEGDAERDPDARPTRPQQPSETHPDGVETEPAVEHAPLPTVLPLRLRTVVWAAVVVLVIAGAGWVASSFTQPQPTVTPSTPHHARAATTGG